MRALDLLLRFSPIATVALAAVAAAGMLMAVFVLDSFGELTGTSWGQILLLKTAAVGLAAMGGAYNHFRLIPSLEAAPGDEEVLAEVRSTITAEAIMLAFVVVVTAWLVAAAS
jgi:copper transport protein